MDFKKILDLGYGIIGQMKYSNASERIGAVWTGGIAVGASLQNITLTMQQRDFDYEIRRIAIRNLNSSTYVEQVGMSVQMYVGIQQMWPVAVDTAFWKVEGGFFVRDIATIFALKTSDIKFVFSNRIATAAWCDVVLYGWKKK